MDFSKILELKNKLDILKNGHPKFFSFLSAVQKKALKEGSIFEIKVTTPEGETLETAIKLTQADIDAIKDLSALSR